MARRKRNGLRDYGLTVAIAVVFALFVRFLFLEAYRIPTAAMKPTLEAGDTIFVSKSAFGMRIPFLEKPLTEPRMPRRGEVILFSLPAEPEREFLKRVIGLPGDTVQLRQGRVILNGTALSPAGSAPCARESLPEGKTYGVCWEPPLIEDFGPEKVPEKFVFVVGDLRSPGASDTPARKSWGIVPLSSLRGSALWTWLSIEPRSLEGAASGSWPFPRFRFERMFRRIE